MYRNLVSKLAERFERRFSEISVHYNFDNGDEFEIALCEAIRSVIPSKYGICRGFIVTKTDECVGDDIIIYERDKFPTFRFLEQDKFDRKEDIPLEAVCAYIEAKNTLYVDNSGGQSLKKALEQVRAVKSLERQLITRGTIEIDNQFLRLPQSEREDWPVEANPLFGAIFARNIKNSKKEIFNLEDSYPLLSSAISNGDFNPDIIICGQDIIAFPCTREVDHDVFSSPFFVKDKSFLMFKREPKKAFGMGVILLLYALGNIRLQKIDWGEVMASELGITKE